MAKNLEGVIDGIGIDVAVGVELPVTVAYCCLPLANTAQASTTAAKRKKGINIEISKVDVATVVWCASFIRLYHWNMIIYL